jgi:hypothetical protein
MAKRSKNERTAKKEVKRLFERSFDVYRLNYAGRIKKAKPKAILYGLLTAFTVYAMGYAGGYYGFNNNIITLEGFAKLVWIMMVPCIVVGLMTFLISKNRMEYPARMDIREYMTELEEGEGLLWKFFPIWEHYDGMTGPTKKALAWSQEHRVEKMDLADYTDAIANLYHIINAQDIKSLDNDVVNKVLHNFGKQD